MKTEYYQLHDISNILGVPKTTIRDRFTMMEIQPFVKNRIGRITKHYYSKTQLETIKYYFEVNGHKKQPKPPTEIIKGYEIADGVCYIIAESKMNF
jgi:hypothetical protein